MSIHPYTYSAWQEEVRQIVAENASLAEKLAAAMVVVEAAIAASDANAEAWQAANEAWADYEPLSRKATALRAAHTQALSEFRRSHQVPE